ncbi:hypothetical protein [Beggiatoa leptomitoformis]|uniref:Uncharacterized protein n=1 Tax=Beggiatoa leptomitoformis TaxID=288004 RepID=A0A2N9YF54_9GAMM|nr:hypothetical protein [Beggiatoa leptomitoformis]ALG68527.1 hypothetical protein AL038_13495 [Beggiatoa leptomitoformis]AUI69131.1 hypothetical protein BLE401_10765 [Beggiatoa leptomitoformis]
MQASTDYQRSFLEKLRKRTWGKDIYTPAIGEWFIEVEESTTEGQKPLAFKKITAIQENQIFCGEERYWTQHHGKAGKKIGDSPNKCIVLTMITAELLEQFAANLQQTQKTETLQDNLRLQILSLSQTMYNQTVNGQFSTKLFSDVVDQLMTLRDKLKDAENPKIF